MASPHIVSKYASSAADRRLVAGDGHLLVISKGLSSWSNKELIVTPSEEYFTCAATYAKYNSSESTKYNQKMNATDGQTLTSSLASIFNSKTTTNSWNGGHKPCFAYWARGYTYISQFLGESTCDPWYAKKTGDVTPDSFKHSVGCGASWSALYFNLYALPLYRASTRGMFMRIYNPSWMALDWDNTVVPNPLGRKLTSPPSSLVGNGATKMQYNIFGDLVPPTELESTTDVSTKIEFANTAVSNQGNVGVDFDKTDGKNHGFYNPWDNDLTYASSATPYYHPTDSHDDYYVDIALPDAMKTRILTLQEEGAGGLWLLIGPVIKNYFTSNLFPGHCAMMFFSRIELRFVLSMSGFNNT